jgi:uncharacterized protein YggT (Ycf19 family)
MGTIDLILNITGVLLWFNWRSFGFDPLAYSTPATLAGTLRPAEPRQLRRWRYLAGLLLLLLLRAYFYWQIGPAVDWTPHIHLGAIVIPLRSDIFLRDCLFSLLSFLISLGACYLSLLLLSLVNGRAGQGDPVQRAASSHLGVADRFPWPIRFLLPLLCAGAFWLVLSPLLTRWQIIPKPASWRHLSEQAAAVGLGAYLAWKYVIIGLLAVYLLTSYVYFGNHPFWTFITLTGRNILIPLRVLPLRIGKLDLAPLIAITLVIFGAEFAQRGLTRLYERLPL